MTQSDIKKKIEGLAGRESDISRSVAITPTRTAECWEIASQSLLEGSAPNHPLNLRAVSGAWGIAVNNVPITYQLLVYPTLIVDLYPYKDEKGFFGRYGLEIPRALRLASRGHIVFNLIEYESQKSTGFAQYCASPRIEQFLEQPWMRINSIRRQRFLDAVAPEDKQDEYRSTGSRLFSDAIRRLPDIQRYLHAGYSDAPGAIKAVSENFMYLNLLATSDNGVLQWLQEIPSTVSVESAGQWIDNIRGFKTLVASPYTAAFGGFVNYNKRRLEQTASIKHYLPEEIPNDRRRYLSPSMIGGLQLVHEIAHGGLSGSDLPNTVEATRSLDENQFNSFSDFLADIVARQNHALKLLASVRETVAGERRLATMCDYLREIKSIQVQYKAAPAVTVIAGGLVAAGIAPFSTWISLILGSSVFLVSVAKDATRESLSRKLLSRSKAQVIDSMGELIKWQQEREAKSKWLWS
jgi:hypothetical protein